MTCHNLLQGKRMVARLCEFSCEPEVFELSKSAFHSLLSHRQSDGHSCLGKAMKLWIIHTEMNFLKTTYNKIPFQVYSFVNVYACMCTHIYCTSLYKYAHMHLSTHQPLQNKKITFLRMSQLMIFEVSWPCKSPSTPLVRAGKQLGLIRPWFNDRNSLPFFLIPLWT